MRSIALMINTFLSNNLRLFTLTSLTNFIKLQRPFKLNIRLNHRITRMQRRIINNNQHMTIRVSRHLRHTLLINTTKMRPMSQAILMRLSIIVVGVISRMFTRQLTRRPLSTNSILLGVLLTRNRARRPPRSNRSIVLRPFVLNSKSSIIQIQLRQKVQGLHVVINRDLALKNRGRAKFIRQMTARRTTSHVKSSLLSSVSHRRFVALNKYVLQMYRY